MLGFYSSLRNYNKHSMSSQRDLNSMKKKEPMMMKKGQKEEEEEKVMSACS